MDRGGSAALSAACGRIGEATADVTAVPREDDADRPDTDIPVQTGTKEITSMMRITVLHQGSRIAIRTALLGLLGLSPLQARAQDDGPATTGRGPDAGIGRPDAPGWGFVVGADALCKNPTR